MGNRFGPVLRNRPPLDSAAAQMEWSESMDELAAMRKPGRFTRDSQDAESVPRDVLPR